MRRALVLVLCLGLAGCAAPAKGTVWSAPSPAARSASPAASPSPSPSPAASASPSPIAVPAGVLAGIAVFDRQSGAFTVQRNATTRFRSASLVKLFIALDYLWNRDPGFAIPAADRPKLDIMLRSSDDNAASYFWDRDGRDQIVSRMVSRLGLHDTTPPSAVDRTGWGSTGLSAADVVRVYRYLLDTAPAPVRDFVMGNLHQSTPCGTDRYDETFGIPSAFAKPWAAKQGWHGFGDVPAQPCTKGAPVTPAAGPPAGPVVDAVGILDGAVLHTTGTVGPDDRSIVVVLTQQRTGTPFSTAVANLTRLVRSLPVPGAVPT